ncbi:thioredoxin-disulfide reductase [Maridesulfovibrio hydrothermalis]|uniref:Thioredoxin reductase n=1 Tax=Maridesulfovibrio hydrothermalis AM13 = DSM 14728 TaxID=1121451 RepID=L0RDX1_9BACT|nr:thioredoxin-disulfide reductase [Maridesulfovibrio hydrothermalis]CCO24395.1 Thioredoxin reductase [Maridesulfovibrio hydrothermalis AM13 = DSM 14728]
MRSYDAVVIGGGPAGMAAALYLARAGVHFLVVEKLSHGGQMLLTDELENFPGFPDGVKGYELADRMDEHVKQYEFDHHYDEVQKVIPGEEFHEVVIDGEHIKTRVIIIASGVTFRKLKVPNEEKLLGRGVSYCALCDGNFFKGKKVAVIGGGNSALEESIYLSRLVKKLYLVHRRGEFRADKVYQDKCLANPVIEPVLNAVVSKIIGDDEVVGVETRNTETGEYSILDVDGVFIFVGYNAVCSFFPENLALDQYGFIKTTCEMESSIPGIYAAGDIRSKKCRQVVTAVGDGATAATAAFAYLEHK